MGGRWCSQCGSCCTSLYELGSIHATGSRVRTCRLRLANIEGALTSPDWEHPWSMGATPQKSKSPRPDKPTGGHLMRTRRVLLADYTGLVVALGLKPCLQPLPIGLLGFYKCGLTVLTWSEDALLTIAACSVALSTLGTEDGGIGRIVAWISQSRPRHQPHHHHRYHDQQ